MMQGPRYDRRRTARALIALALAAIATVGMVSPAAGQTRRALGGQAAGAEPGDVNRLFDAYAVMQAQETLGLDDAQFGPFVTRLRALQDQRRRHVRERNQAIQELRRLLQSAGNEPALRERLEGLARLDAAAHVETAKAAAAVDELLDVRQRARWRVLQQQLELRKLELVARARQRLRARP